MISPHKVETNGQQIAVYDLGGDGPPVVVTHGASLCGMMMAPAVAALQQTHRVFCVDLRAHGQSTNSETPAMTWDAIASDLPAVFDYIRSTSGVSDDHQLLGVGHSLGGACLIMAEHQVPGSLKALWLYEPIFFPKEPPIHLARSQLLIDGALRRKTGFESLGAAKERLGSKPPMGSFTTECLDAYLQFGINDIDDETEEGHTVVVACDPQLEAEIYKNANSGSGQLISETELAITIAVGGDDGDRVPAIKNSVAGLDLDVSEFDGFGHFAPFEHPEVIAQEVASWAASSTS